MLIGDKPTRSPSLNRTAESERATPFLDWLLLTKRPENVRRMWPESTFVDDDAILDMMARRDIAPRVMRRENVWIGTSVSDQKTFEEFAAHLIKVRDLASVLFLSAEPLLGPLNISGYADPLGMEYVEHHPVGYSGGSPIDLIIIGGESGPHARPCHVEWIRSLVQQCQDTGIKPFVKQLGAKPWEEYYLDDDQRRERILDGKHKVMQYVHDGYGAHYVEWDHQTFGQPSPGSMVEWYPKDKKGGDFEEFPKDLRIREMPR